jgi:5-methylcytosine-specific restriction endonuclease McrA
VLESGERCDCTRKLEYDHILALALGGKSTLDNVRLACRPPVGSPRFSTRALRMQWSGTAPSLI